MTSTTSSEQKKSLEIREARSDADYHLAYPIIRQLFPQLDMQTYARRVFVARATGYRMFMGEVDKKLVGVIGVIANHNLHDGFVTYIEHVVVDKKYRGHGYGSELIQFAEDRAREEGCYLIELDTDTDAFRAAKLYENSGYKKSGNYYFKDLRDDEIHSE
jgi:GNAT superfamily N-acetyltransferase